MAFLTEEQIKAMGFHHVGENCLLSDKASYYNCNNIIIGNNVRIDDFCLLSGQIKLEQFVHLGAYSALYAGDAGIEIGAYTGLSSRNTFYAMSDDYSGNYSGNSAVDINFRKIDKRKLCIGKHCLFGANCVVLPGAVIHEGCAFGSFTLVRTEVQPWTISIGIPSRVIKPRSKNLLRFFE